MTVIVGEALVRYINQGVTLGSVNLPEVNMRSLTLEEPNHARVRLRASGAYLPRNIADNKQVIYVHRNVPGVLRKVNAVLGNHNVDKQTSDSKGEVRAF